MISLLEVTKKKPMSLKKKIGIGIGSGLAAAGAGYAAYKNKDNAFEKAFKNIKFKPSIWDKLNRLGR